MSCSALAQIRHVGSIGPCASGTSWLAFGRCLLAAMSALALASCVSVDTRASRELVSVEKTAQLDARFRNFPLYHSTSSQFIAPATLAQYLGIELPGTEFESVRVVYRDATGLTLKFLDGGKGGYTRQFTPRDGVHRDPEGRIVVPQAGNGCQGGSDSPTLGGCARGETTLFVNREGQLVVEATRSVVGTIGIIPVAAHTDWVAIFRPDTE